MDLRPRILRGPARPPADNGPPPAPKTTAPQYPQPRDPRDRRPPTDPGAGPPAPRPPRSPRRRAPFRPRSPTPAPDPARPPRLAEEERWRAALTAAGLRLRPQPPPPWSQRAALRRRPRQQRPVASEPLPSAGSAADADRSCDALPFPALGPAEADARRPQAAPPGPGPAPEAGLPGPRGVESRRPWALHCACARPPRPPPHPAGRTCGPEWAVAYFNLGRNWCFPPKLSR